MHPLKKLAETRMIWVKMAQAAVLMTPTLAYAQGGGSSPAARKFAEIFDRLIDFGVGFLVILAVVMVIYAAFLFLFAGGDVEKVKTAKKWLFYIAVAIAVGLLSKVIVAIIFEVATGEPPTSL